MMRIHINKNVEGLVSYFTNSLSRDDYFFEEGKNVPGYWHGKLVDEFGLDRRVSQKDFSAFAHNINPKTGERLGLRETEGRRTSIEYCFNAPKSISVVMALTGDREILNAHRLAVKKAMEAVEKDMHTQVRVDGQNTYQKTGNMLYARFDHFTARPIKEENHPHARYSADPMLHSHCIAPNVTMHNGQLRALEGSVVHSVAQYYEAVYHSHLSKSLQDMGYQIERTKDRYEIKGVSRNAIEKFSNRTVEIEKLAKKLGLTDAKKKGELGAKTRLHKSKLDAGADLKKIWLSRLTPKELDAIRTAKGKVAQPPNPITPKGAIDRSLEHCLERNSAIPAKKLLAHALTLGYGALTPKQVRDELKSRSNILYAKDGYLTYLTTKEMVRAEDRMIEFAAGGKNTVRPIHPAYQIQRGFLNAQQRRAIHKILNSTDRVSVLMGAAGVGKSTLLVEIKEAAEQRGGHVVAIAPSSGASRGVLREKGFEGADTVAKFLRDGEMQKQAAGQIILVDEASLVGVKTMNSIFDTARKVNARIILSGDARQHSSPEAGDALRHLSEKASLKIAHVDENLRQRGNPDYKKAIDLLARGRARQGFNQLDRMGAVVEVEETKERHEKIAEDYVRSVEAGRSALVISPTHAEGRLITEAIREKMKGRGRIGQEERTYTIQRNLSLTEAQKKDPAVYEPGTVVQFHQNYRGGYVAGQPYEVVSKSKDGKIHIAKAGEKKLPLPMLAHSRFQVFQRGKLTLAEGDLIRITHNGKSIEGKRLHNGQRMLVKGFTDEGHIKLAGGKTLGKNFANLNYGHVQTSHAAQGKDCQDVFIAQSALSYGASNDKQFYVSASRARETVRVYTDDKDALKTAVARSGERISANEIAKGHYERQHRRRHYYDFLVKNDMDYDRTARKTPDKLQEPVLDKA
ncbi:MAG: relaxase domain-containing protein [Lewinellaceae bacterium]|nr:relaxase domain-containing protein [Saprospiraceae bacterium]MCB9338455.1 relaxase domain-containing protein [Lewinellaceae bacterium]